VFITGLNQEILRWPVEKLHEFESIFVIVRGGRT